MRGLCSMWFVFKVMLVLSFPEVQDFDALAMTCIEFAGFSFSLVTSAACLFTRRVSPRIAPLR